MSTLNLISLNCFQVQYDLGDAALAHTFSSLIPATSYTVSISSTAGSESEETKVQSTTLTKQIPTSEYMCGWPNGQINIFVSTRWYFMIKKPSPGN